MAEFQRMPTQEELQKILYMGQMQGKTTQEIINENLNKGGTIKPLPENFFTTASAGAKRAGDYINRAGTAADVAKLFPGYQPETKVTIPTSFNVVPKMDPYSGQVGGTGINTQQMPIGNVLQQIKPADVLGVSGAERAYGDIGAGKAPQPFDVVDTLGLGAGGIAAGKGLLGVAKATKGMPVGLSIKETTGLLETAPKSDIGFYSAVENAAMASPRKSATGQAFLNDIMKGQDVRADEIKWMGLDDYLKDKKSITKQEVQDYIANNRVDVKEVELSDTGYRKKFSLNSPEDEDFYDVVDKNNNVVFSGREDDADYFMDRSQTKFGQYTLPGGENYREILLTMPTQGSGGKRVRVYTSDGMSAVQVMNDAEIQKMAESGRRKFEVLDEINPQGTYQSSHFDQPNILAHLRVNDRVDADGKKMLLIEEVQSDWHQAGRDKGYAKNVKDEIAAIQKQMDELGDQRDPVTNQLVNEKQWLELGKQKDELVKQSKGVPDAPFKDTWYQLALKRAIQHAAENGYDRIGLTTGKQQADRFDLSKQVNEITVPMVNSDGSRSVRIDPTDGTSIKLMVDKDGVVTGYGSGSTQFSGKKLNEVIGKEMSDKVMKADPETNFSGLDLQVGGEGMKKYYDEIYPKFLDKYGKKWGAKVKEVSLGGESMGRGDIENRLDHLPNGFKTTDGKFWEDYDDAMTHESSLIGSPIVRYLEITPEMKAGVSKGQPLFMAAPIGVTGGLLGTEQDQRK